MKFELLSFTNLILIYVKGTKFLGENLNLKLRHATNFWTLPINACKFLIKLFAGFFLAHKHSVDKKKPREFTLVFSSL